jgi:tRNA nucleotidyltransferase/poly(A) polymerase
MMDKRMQVNSGCSTAFQHPLLLACFAAGQATGLRLVLVGGAVRDALCGKAWSPNFVPDDLDFIVLDGDSRKLATAFADRVTQLLALPRPPRPVMLDDDWGIVRLVLSWAGQPVTLDLANALDNDLLKDLHRRDVTVNAIAWDGRQFIDPTGGRRDIRQQIIRHVHPDNFSNDPLRVLRVFRTATLFDHAAITPDTAWHCQQLAAGLTTVAPERLLVEWLKLLNAPVQRVIHVCQAMPDAVLSLFCPLEKSVFLSHLMQWHTGLQDPKPIKGLLEQLTQHKVQTYPALTWLLWLWVDTALVKLPSYPISREAKQCCKQWSFIMNHISLQAVTHPELDLEQADLFRQWGQYFPGALWLWLLHHQNKTDTPVDVTNYWACWQLYQQRLQQLPPLVTGNTLIQDWGMVPSPKIQQALHALHNAQICGYIQSIDEAKAWLVKTGMLNNLP